MQRHKVVAGIKWLMRSTGWLLMQKHRMAVDAKA